MKLRAKSQEEVIADLIGRIAELEGNLIELVEIVAKRDQEILELKKEMATIEEDLNKKILERDKMIRSQAEAMKALAEGLKDGIKTKHQAPRGRDLEYLATLLIEGGYLHQEQPKKNGTIMKIFGK